jgi:hypothetical protein
VEVSGQLHDPRENASGIYGIRGRVGPRAGVEAVVKIKIAVSTGNRTPVAQPIIYID